MLRTHLLAGVHFPDDMRGFYLSDVEQYDRFGHDLGAKYHPDDGQVPAKVTVYVYPALQPFDEELALTIPGVLQATPGPRWWARRSERSAATKADARFASSVPRVSEPTVWPGSSRWTAGT